MFIITNRRLEPKKSGLKRLGKTPNEQGPNELRLVEVTRRAKKWNVSILPDRMNASQWRKIRSIGVTKEQADPSKDTYYSSYYVLNMLRDRLIDSETQQAKKHLVVFVHGFNNDVEDVLDRAALLEENFGVEVLAFSWPADGGGARGTLSYKSDKRDAQASAPALNRVLGKIDGYLRHLHDEFIAEQTRKAERRFPDDRTKQLEFVAGRLDQHCPVRVTLVAHSMGNYLLKQALKTTTSEATRRIFDNIVLVAADTNCDGHEEWVDRLSPRNRVYVAINEDDIALAASRMKTGDQQHLRLGHAAKGLGAERAVYVDFTSEPSVGRSHAYFEEDALGSPAVHRFFELAFTGLRAEDWIPYDAARNAYEIRRANLTLAVP